MRVSASFVPNRFKLSFPFELAVIYRPTISPAHSDPEIVPRRIRRWASSDRASTDH
jgi:hypothetical protein